MNEKAKEALAQFRALPKVEQCLITLQNKEAAETKKRQAINDFLTAAPVKLAALDTKMEKYAGLIRKARADKAKIINRAETLKEALDKAIAAVKAANKKYQAALNPVPKAKTKKQLLEEAAALAGMTVEAYKAKLAAEEKAAKQAAIAEQTVGVKSGIANAKNPPALTQPTTAEKAAKQAATEKALAKLCGLTDAMDKKAA